MEMKEISSSSGMRGDRRYMMLFRRLNEMDRATGESNDGEGDGRESDGDVSSVTGDVSMFRRQQLGGVSTKRGLGEFQSDVSVAEPQPPTDIARNRPPQLPPNMNCTLRRSVFASLRSSPAAVGTRRLSLFGYTQAKALVYSKYGVPKDVLRYPPASVIPAVS